MSDKLYILIEVEKEIARKVSLESGQFYYWKLKFEKNFSDFTKKVQTFIYNFILKERDGTFYLQLDGLTNYYDELEKAHVPFEKFTFTKEFFEGESIEKFLVHYCQIMNLYNDSTPKNGTTPASKKEKKIHITYLLDPDYVEAKKVVGEPIIQKQTISINRFGLTEKTFLSLGKQLTWEDQDAYLDLTTFEIKDHSLYASFLMDQSDVHRFLQEWILFFEQKENKHDNLDAKATWIERFGSTHLKRAYRMNYHCQRQYVTERATNEFPEFTLDFDQQTKCKERPFPSEKALDVEECLRQSNPTLHVRVEWMQKPEKECEVVVISDYLGKYRLYKKV